MSVKQCGILAFVAVLLLGTAVVIHDGALWSRIGNFTVPWFCSAVALALLVVLLVSGLRAQVPSALPWRAVLGTVLVTAVILAVGIELDADTYRLGSRSGARWEAGGFLAILLGLFLLARGRPAA